MGYLNNQVVTIDAILTRKGRELLAKGDGSFKITQFALADDEIDYTLYNPNHPSGSNYYGEAIENMPLMEAFPDETQMMKYKLVTLPKKVTRIPVVSVSQKNITLQTGGRATISPNTINFSQGNRIFGYTAILSDSDAAFIRVTRRSSRRASMASIPQFIGDNEAAQSVTVTGLQFQVVAKPQPAAAKKATITIVGNETGGRTTINLTVEKQDLETTPGVSIQAQ